MSTSGSVVTPEQPFANVSDAPLETISAYDSATSVPSRQEQTPISARPLAYRSPPHAMPSVGSRQRDESHVSYARQSAITAGGGAGRMPSGHAASAVHAGQSSTSVVDEVFDAQQTRTGSFTRFTPTGRLRRTAQPFANDVTVGKFGVLANSEAEALEGKLLKSFAHDGMALEAKSVAFKESFLSTLHLFLAINSGSIGNVTGRMGVRDDSQPLRFGDVELAAADVATILGDRAYSYMRCRATVIRDTIEAAISTSNLPDAEERFPGVCAAVDLIKVVAATKGLSQYPQYVAVGSQYAAGTPPYLITAILDSASKVLSTTQTNVRQSEVVGVGTINNG